MKQRFSFLIIFLFFLCACHTESSKSKNVLTEPLKSGADLKVLQLNVWMAGSKIENGTEAIADIIIETGADLVTLSEVNTQFMVSLVSALRKKNVTFHFVPTNDCGILTKYPVIEQKFIYSPDEGFNGILKTSITLTDKKLCLYSAHLDYQHYGAFLPRGYDGQSWKKMPAPVTAPDEVLSFNSKSRREDQIGELIRDAARESAKGSIILVGGDFNEPSHLDWVETTKNLYDHKGAIIPWPCTLMLQNAGFCDTYREFFPDPVAHPGFTWPSNNPLVDVNKLSWAPESDERDRIDFIFYQKNQGLKLNKVTIVGPLGTILKGKRDADQLNDSIFSPKVPWPSDHKGILAIFSFEK